jgi:hypothetical protein
VPEIKREYAYVEKCELGDICSVTSLNCRVDILPLAYPSSIISRRQRRNKSVLSGLLRTPSRIAVQEDKAASRKRIATALLGEVKANCTWSIYILGERGIEKMTLFHSVRELTPFVRSCFSSCRSIYDYYRYILFALDRFS